MNYGYQDLDKHTVYRPKVALMSCLLAGFIANGIFGSAAYTALQLHAALSPAGLTIVLGRVHMAYCIFALLSCLLAGFIAGSVLYSALGSIISRLFRHGLHFGYYSNQDWEEHLVHMQNFALVSCLLAGFIAGGICLLVACTTLQRRRSPTSTSTVSATSGSTPAAVHDKSCLPIIAYHAFCIISDGCLLRGNLHESRGGDGISISGHSELSLADDVAKRYGANGVQVSPSPAGRGCRNCKQLSWRYGEFEVPSRRLRPLPPRGTTSLALSLSSAAPSAS